MVVYSHPRRLTRLLLENLSTRIGHLRRRHMSLLRSQNSLSVMLCVIARLLFDPLPFPKLRPKDEECCGGSNQLDVGVLWHFETRIGAFVAGR